MNIRREGRYTTRYIEFENLEKEGPQSYYCYGIGCWKALWGCSVEEVYYDEEQKLDTFLTEEDIEWLSFDPELEFGR